MASQYRAYPAAIPIAYNPFEEAYLFLNGLSINQIDANLKADRILTTYADCLFFVLFQLKNALTYDALGLLIQTDASNA